MPPNTKYVGRGSRFGNPYPVEDALEAGYTNAQEMTVYAYRQWLNGDPIFGGHKIQRQAILNDLVNLRGFDLCCWCKPDEACHADVLIRLANR